MTQPVHRNKADKADKRLIFLVDPTEVTDEEIYRMVRAAVGESDEEE